MLFHLLYEQLFPYFSPLRIFGYITVRTAFASLTALGLGLILGPWLIQKLRQFQIGQYIREDGPKSHHAKAGTPTMGGILILVSIFVPTLLWADLRNSYVWIALLGLTGFGAVGFIDDAAKLRGGSNRGLPARTKFLLQAGMTVLVGACLVWQFARGVYDPRLSLPFFKDVRPDLVITPLLDSALTYPFAFVFFVAFLFLVLAGASNAVNLTDGLDGLASGLAVANALASAPAMTVAAE